MVPDVKSAEESESDDVETDEGDLFVFADDDCAGVDAALGLVGVERRGCICCGGDWFGVE